MFHFQFLHFDGGFAGVDVFFVISGYLMGAILYTNLAKSNQVDFLKFYYSRIKRVYPALFVLLVFLLIFLNYALPTSQHYQLAKEVRYSTLFLYNIKFYSQGYFDQGVDNSWLLHTWTLGLEFQFYLIFPILLWIINKFFPQRILIILTALTVVSFSLMLFKSSVEPKTAFFLLPYRIWEFLLGSIIFIYQSNKINSELKYSQLMSYIGFSLLIVFFLFGSEQPVWPDFRAIIPVLATVMILYANTNTIFTQNKFCQKMGNASYSIYLWHWPFYLACITFGFSELWQLILAAVFSIITAFLSYVYIETPTRSWNKRTFAFVFIPATIALIGLALLVEKKNWLMPFASDFHKKYEFILPYKKYSTERIHDCVAKGEFCILGDQNNPSPSFILVGDSHAGSIAGMLEELAIIHKKSFLSTSFAGCVFILGVNGDTEDAKKCRENNEKVFELLRDEYQGIPIVILNRYNQHILTINESDGYFSPYFMQTKINKNNDEVVQQVREELLQGFLSTACRAAEKSPTYWVTSIPEIGINVPDTMIKNVLYRNDYSEITLPVSEYKKRNARILEKQNQAKQECGVKIIDIAPLLCDEEVCHTRDSQDIYYNDDDHLNMWGARKLKPLFEFLFK